MVPRMMRRKAVDLKSRVFQIKRLERSKLYRGFVRVCEFSFFCIETGIIPKSGDARAFLVNVLIIDLPRPWGSNLNFDIFGLRNVISNKGVNKGVIRVFSWGTHFRGRIWRISLFYVCRTVELIPSNYSLLSSPVILDHRREGPIGSILLDSSSFRPTNLERTFSGVFFTIMSSTFFRSVFNQCLFRKNEFLFQNHPT